MTVQLMDEIQIDHPNEQTILGMSQIGRFKRGSLTSTDLQVWGIKDVFEARFVTSIVDNGFDGIFETRRREEAAEDQFLPVAELER